VRDGGRNEPSELGCNTRQRHHAAPD
jgi:hypothetical protein